MSFYRFEIGCTSSQLYQESNDHQLAEGVVTYQKGSRVIHDTTPLSEEELAKRVQEFVLESTQDLSTSNISHEQEDNDLMMSQEYLREERVHEQWDCETILTTYSTLDNHPSIIKVISLIINITYFRRKERQRRKELAVRTAVVVMVKVSMESFILVAL